MNEQGDEACTGNLVMTHIGGWDGLTKRSITVAHWMLLCILCVLASGCVTYVGHMALFQVYGGVTDESGCPLSGVKVSVVYVLKCGCSQETEGDRGLLAETDESGNIDAELVYEWGRRELGFTSHGSRSKRDRFAIELESTGYSTVRKVYRWPEIFDAETDSCVVDLGSVTLRKDDNAG